MTREPVPHTRRAGHPPSKRRGSRPAGVLFAVLCGALSASVHAASLAEQMGKAMARMLDSYSDSSREKRSGSSAFDFQSGPQSWSNMAPPMGGAPWSGMSPWGASPWGGAWNQWPTPNQLPGNLAMPNWSGSANDSGNQPLNGAWIGNTGQGLVIRGRQFRLFSDRDQYRDMTLRYDGDHIWLYDEDSGTAKRYEFAHAQDRMALRDQEGNTMLFRRWKPSRE